MIKKLTLFFSMLCCAFLLQAQWSTQDISLPRSDMGSGMINGKIFFVGGGLDNTVSDVDLYKRRVDIYDISSGNWTTEQLSVTRQVTFAVGVGTKMYFGGYTQTLVDDQEVVDVYDTQNGSWSTISMPNIDGATSMCAAGDKVFFVHDDNVAIYNTASGSWSSATLSVDRILAYAIGCNGKVLFAGGGFAIGTLHDLVDIYDVSSNSWSTASMSEGKNLIRGACLNNKIYLAGGQTDIGDYSDVIEIFNTEDNTWSTAQMNRQKSGIGVTASNNNLYIAGGYDSNEFEYLDEVEIIDGTTGTKTTSNISTKRSFVSAIATGSKAYFAGGYEKAVSMRVTTVDIYNEGTSSLNNIQQSTYVFSPNPTTDVVLLSTKAGLANTELLRYSLYNHLGVLISAGECRDEIDLSNLHSGLYYVALEGKQIGWQKVIKM